MDPSTTLRDFFLGLPDRCERLVACLQYCLELSKRIVLEDIDVLQQALEKGIFYRNMIEFAPSSIAEQIKIVMAKFSEYYNRLETIGPVIEVGQHLLPEAERSIEHLFELLSQLNARENLRVLGILQFTETISVVSIDTLAQTPEDSYFSALFISQDAELYRSCDIKFLTKLISDKICPTSESFEIFSIECAFIAVHGERTGLETDTNFIGLEELVRERRRIEKVRTMQDLKRLADQFQFEIGEIQANERIAGYDCLPPDLHIEESANMIKNSVDCLPNTAEEYPKSLRDTDVVNIEESSHHLEVDTLNLTLEEQPFVSIVGVEHCIDLVPSFSPQSGPKQVLVSLPPNVLPLSSSVMSEVLKSIPDEDITNYGMRAYLAIKNKVFENRDWGSITASLEFRELGLEENVNQSISAQQMEINLDHDIQLGDGEREEIEVLLQRWQSDMASACEEINGSIETPSQVRQLSSAVADPLRLSQFPYACPSNSLVVADEVLPSSNERRHALESTSLADKSFADSRCSTNQNIPISVSAPLLTDSEVVDLRQGQNGGKTCADLSTGEKWELSQYGNNLDDFNNEFYEKPLDNADVHRVDDRVENVIFLLSEARKKIDDNSRLKLLNQQKRRLLLGSKVMSSISIGTVPFEGNNHRVNKSDEALPKANKIGLEIVRSNEAWMLANTLDLTDEARMKRFEEMKAKKLLQLEKSRQHGGTNTKEQDLGEIDRGISENPPARPMSTGRIRPAANSPVGGILRATPSPSDNAPVRTSSAGHQRVRSTVGTKQGFEDRSHRSGKLLSNQQQVKNALNNVCLAGVHFAALREDAFLTIDKYVSGELIIDQENQEARLATQYLILLYHSKSLAFRGIYAVHPITGEPYRIFGRGPRVLMENQIEEYLKYDSSTRSFKSLPSKSLTSTTDAVSVDPAKIKKQ